jgi:hypothetical protein
MDARQVRRRLVLAGEGDRTYLHVPAGPDGRDRVAGPYSETEALAAIPGIDGRALARIAAARSGPVLRVDLDEVAYDADLVMAGISPVPYEHLDPRVDPSTRRQRAAVDARIVADGTIAPPRELVQSLMASFGLIVDGLFRHGLCSMTRIVLSARHPDWPDWTAITARDREKRAGELPEVVLMRSDRDGSLRIAPTAGALPGSGALVATRFHDYAGSGFLLHAHLLAPVVVDRAFAGLSIINLPPRTPEFGTELGRMLGEDARWVLRRSEGIWCAGSTPEAALDSALACQRAALEAAAARPR